MTSQEFESYVPIYDAIPEDWDEAKVALTERLRKITESLNAKEIGFYLEEELLAGSQFSGPDGNPNEFRSIFRKVVDASPLDLGANSFAHGINIDANFTLIKMHVSATDSTALTSKIIADDDVDLDAVNINITSPAMFDRACAIIEYILEV